MKLHFMKTLTEPSDLGDINWRDFNILLYGKKDIFVPRIT